MGSLAREVLRVVNWDDPRDEWEARPPISWLKSIGSDGDDPGIFLVPAGSRSLVTAKATGAPDLVSGSTHMLIPTFEMSSAEGGEVLDGEETLNILRSLRDGRPDHHLGVADISDIPSVVVSCMTHILHHVSEHTLSEVGPIRAITKSKVIAWELVEIGVPVSNIIIHPLVCTEEVFIVAPPRDLGVFLIKEDRHLMDEELVEEIGMCILDDRRFMSVKTY